MEVHQLLILTVTVASVYGAEQHSPDDYIHTLGSTIWGFWGMTEACANGSYARGFDIQCEKEHGIFDDNTSVNAIKLYCETPDGQQTGEVTSSTLNRGSWRGTSFCPSDSFLVGYDLKVEQESSGDNTAANSLKMWCSGIGEAMEADGNKWGDYIGRSTCPQGRAICGLMTRVQDDQGALHDDTALNDVRFLCCDL